jgi:hypothetical protein
MIITGSREREEEEKLLINKYHFESREPINLGRAGDDCFPVFRLWRRLLIMLPFKFISGADGFRQNYHEPAASLFFRLSVPEKSVSEMTFEI